MKAFAGGQAAAYKMFETINRAPEIDAYSTTGRKLEDIRGEIEFRDVHFSYPTRPDEPIFRGFSLAIPSGTTIALVGQSGSGKSTVISLIERFYDPQLGDVLIDGVNLKEFQLRWIRSKIGLVSQEPVLFAASIKENIAYGKASATDQEVRAAAELANAAKFIDKMPQVRAAAELANALHLSRWFSLISQSVLFLIFHRVSIPRLASMGHSSLVDRSRGSPSQGLF
jgi:ATP-binding cassette, subfamily B (MDR/TAP), member 1